MLFSNFAHAVVVFSFVIIGCGTVATKFSVGGA